MAITFEWDQAKAKVNLAKHGVSFEQATSAFYDPLSLTIPDPMHSVGEFRFILIGVSDAGRTLVVAHSDRGQAIRIISARPTSRKEKNFYEKNHI
jgi:uncharacterized DUF497 family protein